LQGDGDERHIALDMADSADEGELSERQDEDEAEAGEPSVLNVYFGQVMAHLRADENDEYLGFAPDERGDQDATHPLTTLAMLSSQVSSTNTVVSAVNLNRDSLRWLAGGRLDCVVDLDARALLELYVDFDEKCVTLPLVAVIP